MSDMTTKATSTENGQRPLALVVRIVGCAIPPSEDLVEESFAGSIHTTFTEQGIAAASHCALDATSWSHFLLKAGLELVREAVHGGASLNWLERELMGLSQATRGENR